MGDCRFCCTINRFFIHPPERRKRDMTKMSLSNDQTAFEYALYMIASSYFEKPECKSVLLEKRMLIHYKEQKINKQYLFEYVCISYMDDLEKKLPTWFFKKKMEIHLVRKAGFTVVVFRNRNYIMELWGTYRGKNTVVESRLWVKKRRI